MKTLIASFGNPLMGDDAAGPRVLQLLSTYALPPHVVLKDLHAPGVDLLFHLDGVDSLILIDACSTNDPPGTLHVFDRDLLDQFPVEPRSSPHQPGLVETLKLARILGQAPADIHLIAIAASRFDFGASLSSEVESALLPAAETALHLIHRPASHQS